MKTLATPWIASFAAILLSLARAGAAVAPLTDDTFSVSTRPTAINGKATLLNLKPGQKVYLRFDLSRLPAPVSAVGVTSATLTVYVNKVTKPGVFALAAATSDWMEETLSGKALPTVGPDGAVPYMVGADALRHFYTVDLTAQVKAWVGASQVNHGVVLSVPDGSLLNVFFDSKEAITTGHEATLDITLAGGGGTAVPGPQGPQGVAGPAGPQGATGATGATGPAGAAGPIGATGPAGSAGSPGAAGPQGAQGASGVSGLYGDGSGGALNVVASQTLVNFNPQFTNITIAAGTTLTVQSGTILRCTGTFTNNGTIVVLPYAGGGVLRGFMPLTYDNNGTPTTLFVPLSEAPDAGISARAAGNGFSPGLLANVSTQPGGLGLGATAQFLFRVGPKAGGGGGCFGITNITLRGGGSLTVFARGAIQNPGSIQARGESATNQFGVGGGGGGIVMLCSQASVALPGSIDCSGGTGGTNGSTGAAGGGGGGGLVRLAAPIVSGQANGIVAGGLAGANLNSLGFSSHASGGGGGACVGDGGKSGGITVASGTTSPATDGTAGAVYFHQVPDPTALFL